MDDKAKGLTFCCSGALATLRKSFPFVVRKRGILILSRICSQEKGLVDQERRLTKIGQTQRKGNMFTV
jgi:hypothetical protein